MDYRNHLQNCHQRTFVTGDADGVVVAVVVPIRDGVKAVFTDARGDGVAARIVVPVGAGRDHTKILLSLLRVELSSTPSAESPHFC